MRHKRWTYLVCRIGTKDVERRRNELCLDRYCFSADGLSSFECTLDGVDPSWLEAGKLNIRSKFNRLWGQTSSDSRHEGCKDWWRDIQFIEDIGVAIAQSWQGESTMLSGCVCTHVNASLKASYV